jgi:hypothetical protein
MYVALFGISLIPNSAKDLIIYGAIPTNYPHQYVLIDCFNTVTLASSNTALPDDGVCAETCRNCFNVNFNVNFKIVF